jgi:P4 family phage/plasmid primase-like protien
MPDGGLPGDATALRLRLLANGWVPVPITAPHCRRPEVRSPGKQPFLPRWQTFTAETLDEATVRGWARLADQPGTGLVCGRLVVADLDAPVEEVAERLKATAFALLGPSPFVRVGRAPKLALCYRVDQPVTKMLTPELFLGDGTKLQVEVLGAGQQVVGYGIHPDTGRPYAWPDAAPHTHAFADVPETTREALAAFVAAAEGILRAAGGVPKGSPERAGAAGRGPGSPRRREGRIAHALAHPGPTRAEVEDALHHVPNTHDWHGWVRIGAALFDALGDDGEELFAAWSARSPKDDPRATRAKWASFRTSPMTEVTAASLFWEARQNGWVPERERRAGRIGDADARAEGDAGGDRANAVELTEDGVALAFARRRRDDLRYCHDAGAWFVWAGTHWRQNRDGLAFAWARELVRGLNRDEADRIKASTGRAAFAGAVERFAQSDRAFAVTAEAWDRDPYLLGTPGGVVDLRTGDLRPARREDMITKVTAVAPAPWGVPCDRWLAFLDQATGKDADLIAFLQRWCGYCLTGDIREHALLFVFGPGGNGKSVFLNTVSRVLGDYARVAPMETFTASISDRHPTELAMLRGARLVTATETEEGRAWAEARIKQMTGGDPVSARFMRQDFFTFTPQFKLLIAGNHRPALRNVDEAARRRFNVVPFLQRPEHPDRQLEERLRQEWPAILRWMIDGCLQWQGDGLRRPDAVTAATEEYFEAQDAYAQWLRECCDLDPSGVFRERPSILLESFGRWCEANGEPAPDNRRLRGLLERTPGVRYVTTKGYTFVRGIRLLTPEEQRRRKQEAEQENAPGVRGGDPTQA